MKMISKPRRSGKTTQLIELSAQDFGYIVCHSHEDAYRITIEAEVKGLDIPFPLTYREFIDGAFYGKGIRSFYIDNMEHLLATLARGVEVKAFTMTDDEVAK